MYCDYWNLEKPPFDNIPDPSMHVNCGTSLEEVISQTIFAIKEANEGFAVIIGAAGLGKTLSLRIIIDSLEPEKYKVVLITNPSLSFTQLLREMVSQITGEHCTENRKMDLLEIFKHLLFQTMKQGRKIAIFIDEASSLSHANLENLRLLTNMQDDQNNLFTLVLAGQLDLAQRLEHPKRANLFQRIGTYVRIDKLPSEETVKSYIEKRLQLAGTTIKIFSDECFPVIWEHSDQGVPRLINKICKLCLNEGEAKKLDYIQADTVSQIIERFQKLSKTAIQTRKPRIRLDMDIPPENAASFVIENISKTESSFEAGPEISLGQETDDWQAATPSHESPEEREPLELPVLETSPVPEMVEQILTGEARDDQQTAVIPVAETQSFDQTNKQPPGSSPAEYLEPQIKPESELSDAEDPAASYSEKLVTKPSLAEDVKGSAADKIDQETEVEVEVEVEFFAPDAGIVNPFPTEPPKDASIVSGDSCKTGSEHPETGKSAQSVIENPDEIMIGEHRILLDIPKEILKQVKSFNKENARKSAGFWAAQIIKKNPQLTSSPQTDPVHIWNEIKDNILKKITV